MAWKPSSSVSGDQHQTDLTDRRLAQARRVERWQRVDRRAPALNGGLNEAALCNKRRCPMGKKGVRLWMERGDGADDVGREGVGDWEERAIFPGFGRFFGVWADVFTAPGGAFGVSQCAWGSGGHDVSMGAGGLGTSVEGRGQARRSPWPQAGHVRKARWRSLRSSASSGSVGEAASCSAGEKVGR